MLTLSIVLLLAGTAMGQVPALGSCPKVQVLTDFQVEEYMGVWYEVEKYFTIFQFGGKCTQANYTLNDNGTVTVVNQQISSFTGTAASIKGSAKFEGKPNESKLWVTFPTVPFGGEAPYWVLGTDYDNYAVVWSCTDFGMISSKFVWILAREPSPSVEVMQKAYAILDKNEISRAYLTRTDQKNCPARK